MKKIVCLLLVLLSILTVSIACAKTQKLSSTAIVYKSASTHSTKLGKLPAGSNVKVVSIKGSWAKLDIDGYTGYIKTSALKTIKTGTYKARLSAKVYSTPSSNGHSLGRLKKGEKIEVIKIDGTWVRIRFGGTYGYVRLSQVRKSSK